MDIPVFHDDQHGTAIIAAAGLINALELTGRDIEERRSSSVNGAGAAGIACLDLLMAMGMPRTNVILCDTKGVDLPGPQGRHEPVEVGLRRQDQGAHAGRRAEGRRRVLRPLGQGRRDAEMVKTMAKKPIIFAMANPDPEITPEEVPRRPRRCDRRHRPLRLSEPDQQRPGLSLHLPRRARCARAPTINDEMKIAAAHALAELAREDVPDRGRGRLSRPRVRVFGPDYIIPAPFDPRLMSHVSAGGRQGGDGDRRRAQADRRHGRLHGAPVGAGSTRSSAALQRIFDKRARRARSASSSPKARKNRDPRRQRLRTSTGFGTADPDRHATRPCAEQRQRAGHRRFASEFEMLDTRRRPLYRAFADYLYARLQRTRLSAPRLPAPRSNNDRNIFAACMVAHGDADAMVDRRHAQLTNGARRRAPRARPEARAPRHRRDARSVPRPHGVRRRHHRPRHADRAGNRRHRRRKPPRGARKLRLGAARGAAGLFDVRPSARASVRTRCARRCEILDQRKVDFEYDGEMAADVALNARRWRLYPFCRLSDTANVLVMPAFHAASISTKMLQELGGATAIGPMLVGLDQSVQICPLGAMDSDIVNLAALAAYGAGRA